MNRAAILLGIFLAACASDGRNLRPGVADEAAVRADMGAPAETVALPNGGQALFFTRGPAGRNTVRVELGPDGKVRAVEQPLDERNFDRIVNGKTTGDEVHAMLGTPYYVWRLPSGELAWEYKYFWGMDDPWRLYVGIGPNGIVTGQARQQERDGGNRPSS
jgi:hypothetical protein